MASFLLILLPAGNLLAGRLLSVRDEAAEKPIP